MKLFECEEKKYVKLSNGRSCEIREGKPDWSSKSTKKAKLISPTVETYSEEIPEEITAEEMIYLSSRYQSMVFEAALHWGMERGIKISETCDPYTAIAFSLASNQLNDMYYFFWSETGQQPHEWLKQSAPCGQLKSLRLQAELSVTECCRLAAIENLPASESTWYGWEAGDYDEIPSGMMFAIAWLKLWLQSGAVK